MIEIILGKPEKLKNHSGRYRSHVTTNNELDIDIGNGIAQESYDFHRRMQFVLAHLEALRAIECTVRVAVQRSSRVSLVTGRIVIWHEELEPIVRNAVQCIGKLCDTESHPVPDGFKASLKFTINRTVELLYPRLHAV